jgi:hypothetical protein
VAGVCIRTDEENQMAFTTYENRANPHVTVHKDGCSQIKKRGGEHQHGQGEYHFHASYEDAHRYAAATDLPVRDCSFCKPA